MSDDYSTFDAAYVLGALTPEDAAAYEAHLATCADCRQAVDELTGLPDLLAQVPPAEAVAATAPTSRDTNDASVAVPDTLLPRLLDEVARARTRRRWGVAAVGLAAAAALIVALVAVWPSSTPPTNRPVAMTAVSTSVPIHATAQFDDRSWGTLIRLRCTYDAVSTSHYTGGTTSTSYSLVVTDTKGRTQQIATWKVVPGRVSTVEGSTGLHEDEISTISVRSSQDAPVLTLHL